MGTWGSLFYHAVRWSLPLILNCPNTTGEQDRLLLGLKLLHSHWGGGGGGKIYFGEGGGVGWGVGGGVEQHMLGRLGACV